MDNKELFIIDVVPLCFVPISLSPIVSYTSERELNRGSLVKVEYGKKVTEAIVLRSNNIKNKKLILKKVNTFELKPVHEVTDNQPIVSEETVNTAIHIFNITLSPLGVCLKTLNSLIEPIHKLPIETSNVAQQGNSTSDSKFYSLYLKPDFYHLEELFKVIQKYLNYKKKVIYILPDEDHVKAMAEKVAHLKPIIFGLKNKKSVVRDSISKLLKDTYGLFIGTRSLGLLPYGNNVGAIIIEDFRSKSYSSMSKPIFSIVDILLFKKKYLKCDLIFLDSVPPLIEDKIILNNKAPSPLIEKVNMVEELKHQNFSPISSKALELLKLVKENNKSILFLCPRKGYAPAIGCKTCGKIIKCEKCNSFLKLSVVPSDRIVCLKCKSEFLPDICPICNTKKALSPLGNGVEKVYEYISWHLKKSDPDIEALLVGAKTPLELIKSSNVCISTQHIISRYLLTKFDFTVIIDSELFNIQPVFDANENNLRILSLVRLMTKLKIFTQSYHNEADTGFKEDDIVLQEELEARKMTKLPPFHDLVEIFYESNNEDKAKIDCFKDFKLISHFINENKYEIFIDPPHQVAPTTQNKYSFKVNIRGDWPNTKTRNSILTKINPKSIIKIKERWT